MFALAVGTGARRRRRLSGDNGGDDGQSEDKGHCCAKFFHRACLLGRENVGRVFAAVEVSDPESLLPILITRGSEKPQSHETRRRGGFVVAVSRNAESSHSSVPP